MSSSLLSGELQQAKLVLLGDMGAGKSSLVLRFVKGQFHDYQVKREEEEEGRNRWLTAGVLSLLALSLFSSLLERKTLACFAASKELEALYAVDRRKKRREQQQRGESDDASMGMNRCMAKNPRGKRRSVFFLLLSHPPPPPPPLFARCPSFSSNPDPSKQESTIGAAFLTKSMPDHGVKFEIW